jgi:hypothetical protein
VNIQAAISLVAERYPDIVYPADWWFEDKGEGPVIANWPAGIMFPSDTDIQARAVELTIKAALVLNNEAYNKATRAITADYPQLEKDTWPTQDKESKAWVADPENAVTPWINRAATTRGIERGEYLRRTLAKAWQFEVISYYLTGTRQKYEDQIKAGGMPALDYSISPEIYAEMQVQSLQIMTTPAADLQGLF